VTAPDEIRAVVAWVQVVVLHPGGFFGSVSVRSRPRRASRR
jgi:hypothetical protein